MKKIIIGTLLATLSLSATAWEGHGFRIISEHVTTNGIEGNVVHSSKNLAQTTAATWDSRGKVRENIRVAGQHTAYINNYTQSKQRYKITYKVEADGQNCIASTEVEVDKGGTVSDMANTYFSTNKNNPGSWQIVATTEVKGESSDSRRASASLIVTK